MVQSSFMQLFKEFARKSECECGTSSSCDTLECLCRPRFFAGQLLTDQDLKQLDHYIVAKGRLHNRHLHGSGVVCGLEVVCDPCDTGVTVREGYALGPCGEDIVVCEDVKVPVGDLIREFRKQQVRDSHCGDRYERADDGCEAAEQDWVLSICYEERPSRGVVSLKSPKKNGSCSCGSNGKGSSCGCGGSNGSTKTASCSCKQTRTSSPQCEPTLTCEGYRFEVKKAPKKTDRDSSGLTEMMSRSQLVQKVMNCLFSIVGQVTQLPNEKDPNSLVDYCCTLKGELKEIVRGGNVHNCRLIEDLNDIVCPDVNDPEFTPKLSAAIGSLYKVAIELFKNCVCSALLPPCSAGGGDSCVPLATLTVRTSNLQVLSICNWNVRKFALSFPMLGYWLDWLPFFDGLRDAVTKLCCTKSKQRYTLTDKMDVRYQRVEPISVAQPATAAEARAVGGTGEVASAGTRRSSAAAEVGLQYAKSTNPLSGLDATVLAALGLKGEGGEDLASDLELMNPFASLALSRLAAPAFAGLVPNDVFERVQGARAKGEVSVTSVDDKRMAKVEKELASMKKTIATQNATIKKLSKGGKGNG